MEKPLVSVIVPCYNQAQYLSESLNSVINQTYLNWECIVINDGSPDNTEEVVTLFSEKDNRIKYVYQENSGVATARNTGINKSGGVFILPLDADDKIREDYLEKAMQYFVDYPEIKLVYSKVQGFGAYNQECELLPYNYLTILYRNMIYPAAFFRKSDFDKTIGFNPNMVEGYEDWDFWLSLLSEKDKVYQIPELCFYYRVKDVSRDALLTPKIRLSLLEVLFENHKEIYEQYMPEFINLMSNNVTEKYKLNWEIDYLKAELDKRLNSKAYKLGKFLLNPFKR